MNKEKRYKKALEIIYKYDTLHDRKSVKHLKEIAFYALHGNSHSLDLSVDPTPLKSIDKASDQSQ